MMHTEQDDILSDVAAYYSGKLAEHGVNARGVDWNGEESQVVRFGELCRIISPPDSFSINDLGCGYGALVDFLTSGYEDFSYSGFDVSQTMIGAAEQRHRDRPKVRFARSSTPDQCADFGVASGIFNVRMGRTDAEWRDYVDGTLDTLDRTSRLGFSFNCLTSYSDADKMRDALFYADPAAMFDFCKRRYSRNVALLHDYNLYEFTILVRKQA